MRDMSLGAKLGVEFLGTFILVFLGLGSAVNAAKFLSLDSTTNTQVQLGIGFLGVAFAVGLAVMASAFAFGHVSGGHFNPAVSIGLAVARRFGWKDVLPYAAAQIVGATVGAALLFVVALGREGSTAGAVRASGFASNGYGDLSPGHYSLLAGLLTEIILTAVFLFIILGATDDRAAKGFAPIAIGLGLTLIHLVGIPVTNLSVNPARSLGTAFFAGGQYLAQVWLFIVAPIIGAVIAGATYAALTGITTGAEADEGVANNPRTSPSPR